MQDWIAAALRECADHGKKYGVRIGVQNHGDFLKTGEELLALVKAVGSPFCRPIVDTGYFKSKDPYADMALVAPQAVNWQIKQSPFGEESEIPTDLPKLLGIIHDSGYSGYLPIETLSPKGKEYDLFTVVPASRSNCVRRLPRWLNRCRGPSHDDDQSGRFTKERVENGRPLRNRAVSVQCRCIR